MKLTEIEPLHKVRLPDWGEKKYVMWDTYGELRDHNLCRVKLSKGVIPDLLRDDWVDGGEG